MKLKRLALIATLLVFVAAAAGVWWLSRNLDDIAKSAIQNYGSAMTLAKVKVGTVQLSPTTGKGSIRDLSITNPKGFKTSHALKVGRIEVDVDISTVTDKVIVIRKIAIEAPDVVYEKGDPLTNFDALMRNITLYIGESTPSSSSSGRKLIVDSLTIRNAKAQATAPLLSGKTVTVDLPDITLKNVGRAQGGVTPGELGGIVANALRDRLAATISFNRLWQSGGQMLDKAGSALKNLFGK
ncbi:hypothetical protein [Rhodoferax saidenbachensis]|uniref:AsmA domain-containing protein n=1 Tax=Rhodoferax saidenbachensis TaxID=1484693 RepID=A0A1P8K8K4_9BURK|nr:hypothetical protein [Rhodoferax saidenbachensis]APW42321.1 hypothetical protein RS694_07055 [Rhodoferax saidenbachensis]